MRKRAAIVSMGYSNRSDYGDILGALPGVHAEVRGILDGMSPEDVERKARPQGDELFIVSTLPDGREITIAEDVAKRLTNACLEELSKEGFDAALIVCTGHFSPPKLDMTVLVPERIIPELLRAIGVKKLGSIVPAPEQIEDSSAQYSEFDPIVRAASPFGPKEALQETAASFKDEPVDIILADCMGFTRSMGEVLAAQAGKQVFVPRVVLPALLGALMI